MTYNQDKPLLKLNEPQPTERRSGSGMGSPGRTFTQDSQRERLGPKFQSLKDALGRDGGLIELRADPTALAPERLLVFETTGDVSAFYKAVGRVPGLEFVGEENLVGDEEDETPDNYLLMPSEASLRELLSLWERWLRGEPMDIGFTPWRDVFAQLRAIRPWGPADRVSPENRQILMDQIEGHNPENLLRIEIDLVFRSNDATASASQNVVISQITASGGTVVSQCRRAEFAYHGILADLPMEEIGKIVQLNADSLAGSDPVSLIVPQSTSDSGFTEFEPDNDGAGIKFEAPVGGEPVVAVFDAVPIQAHPVLANGIIVDDPDELEEKAVGLRLHGTAMASLALHGDLKGPLRPVRRPIYFRPVMYAPNWGNECFDEDRLVVDVICEAVETMHQNGGAEVVAINLSLGNIYRPFSGRVSTWARALDYLSFRYGVLFLVSAGNDTRPIEISGVNSNQEFNELSDEEKSNCIASAFNDVKADRRILSPGESINSLTIGAWHHEVNNLANPNQSLFIPHPNKEMPNLSSRVGLGVSNAVKPDVLFEGGREHTRLNITSPPVLLASHGVGNRFAGICVAAQQQGTRIHGYQLGSSVATAMATHTSARLYDLLEREYPDQFLNLPKPEKATLIKALLIHSANWRGRGEGLRSIIDPAQSMHWEHWRAEVSRILGYGFVEPDEAIYCAESRATLWATGELLPEEAKKYSIGLPDEIESLAGIREIRATLAWFSPARPQFMTYRASKLRIASLGAEDFSTLGVGTISDEPGWHQIERGTVSHRRWRNNRLGDFNGETEFSISIQRDKDQGIPIDEPISYGLAVTIEHADGETIYDDILASVLIKPRSRIPVRT